MNLMIDLETLGNGTDAVVTSIGATFFDENKIYGKFYKILDYSDQLEKGRKVNADTINWWMKQSDEARKHFNESSVSTEKALQEFVKHVTDYAEKKAKPWGNGATFDISIIESLLSDFGVDIPWSFRNVRDMRTLVSVAKKKVPKPERAGTAHNALDDATFQAEWVQNIFKYLKSIF